MVITVEPIIFLLDRKAAFSRNVIPAAGILRRNPQLQLPEPIDSQLNMNHSEKWCCSKGSRVEMGVSNDVMISCLDSQAPRRFFMMRAVSMSGLHTSIRLAFVDADECGHALASRIGFCVPTPLFPSASPQCLAGGRGGTLAPHLQIKFHKLPPPPSWCALSLVRWGA